MNSVKSLFYIATNVFVRHVRLLEAYTEAIAPVLYEHLLEACLKTDRILSARHLFLCWPLEKISLVNCKEFTEEYALVLVHSLQSLQSRSCNIKLREIDLTGCNIGKRVRLFKKYNIFHVYMQLTLFARTSFASSNHFEKKINKGRLRLSAPRCLFYP